MVLEMDNKGAVDHSNSWRVGGHMPHVGTKHVFPRELKEDGILLVNSFTPMGVYIRPLFFALF